MRTFVIVFFLIIVMNLKGQDNSNKNPEGFTDSRDGKHYKIVNIENQIWMAENLAYNPGEGAWAYDNDLGNLTAYGYLYDWETAIKVCPAGWHLPGEEEWKVLIENLGGMEYAGGKMKETGGTHWQNRSNGKVNEGASNESGFTALPGGRYGEVTSSKPAEFTDLGILAYWWSANDIYGRYAWFRVVGETPTGIGYDYYLKHYRLSVRCIKD